MAIQACGASAGDQPLAPMDIDRREPGTQDGRHDRAPASIAGCRRADPPAAAIAIQKIETAFDGMPRSDVKYRFTIDGATLVA